MRSVNKFMPLAVFLAILHVTSASAQNVASGASPAKSPTRKAPACQALPWRRRRRRADGQSTADGVWPAAPV